MPDDVVRHLAHGVLAGPDRKANSWTADQTATVAAWPVPGMQRIRATVNGVHAAELAPRWQVPVTRRRGPASQARPQERRIRLIRNGFHLRVGAGRAKPDDLPGRRGSALGACRAAHSAARCRNSSAASRVQTNHPALARPFCWPGRSCHDQDHPVHTNEETRSRTGAIEPAYRCPECLAPSPQRNQRSGARLPGPMRQNRWFWMPATSRTVIVCGVPNGGSRAVAAASGPNAA
jgi:hypothetical protein